jgi:hypothetical protein
MIDIVYYSPELRVYRDGRVERLWRRGGKWKLIKNTKNHIQGYNQIKVNDTMILRHRIMAFCFKNLSTILFDNIQVIDHIDRNRLNNNINNLRVVTQQENNENRGDVKGYWLDKRDNRFYADIKVNKKKKHLGGFNTAEEAHQAYLTAKQIYHVIEI